MSVLGQRNDVRKSVGVFGASSRRRLRARLFERTNRVTRMGDSDVVPFRQRVRIARTWEYFYRPREVLELDPTSVNNKKKVLAVTALAVRTETGTSSDLCRWQD